MGKAKVGDRVIAIVGAEEGTETVKIFGSGVRIEDEVPVKGVYMMGIDMNEIGHPNPTILLDTGKKVYGCECWWGSEEVAKKRLEGWETVVVDPDDYRAEAKAQAEKLDAQDRAEVAGEIAQEG